MNEGGFTCSSRRFLFPNKKRTSKGAQRTWKIALDNGYNDETFMRDFCGHRHHHYPSCLLINQHLTFGKKEPKSAGSAMVTPSSGVLPRQIDCGSPIKCIFFPSSNRVQWHQAYYHDLIHSYQFPTMLFFGGGVSCSCSISLPLPPAF